MAVSVSNLVRSKNNNDFIIKGDLTFDSSYPTGGESLSAALVGLAYMTDFEVNGFESGYGFQSDLATGGDTVTIKVYQGGEGGFTPAGTNSTSSVTGTAAAQTFTGSASVLDLATPVFSGTGYTTAGQVITTTDNQTMTLNQCAGMWLIADALSSTAPVLIISNTAVTGAPAVLTVIGTAPATDAGTYKIVATLPVGTNAASASLTATAAAQTFTGTAVPAGAADEVANATDLSSLTVKFTAWGK